MPIYEFECSTCGTRFDRLQKLSDPDPAACPECGKPTIKRCLTAPSFRLAGSGWYETDFKKDSDKKRNLAGKDEAPKTESKPDNSGASPAPAADAGKSATTKTASTDSKSSTANATKTGKQETAKNRPASGT
jgi:putative FmdB family regulatory protein